MALVSRLCFAGDTPPEEAVIRRLLGLVTRESSLAAQAGDPSALIRTKQMSPFPDECIDPTPVVRSFLLRLLLKSELVDMLQISRPKMISECNKKDKNPKY